MADFSIQSTQINPVANAVTPKAGVEERSGEMILRAFGSAIEPSVNLYGAVKEEQFRKEAEGNFRMDLGYKADPLGNEYAPMTSGEKEMAEKADRAAQARAMGGVRNAELSLEARLRERIAREPWLADRYRRATAAVRSEYQQTVELLTAQEAASQAAQTEEQKIRAAKEKALQANLMQAQLAPMKDDGSPLLVQDMTDAEINQWQWLATNKLQERQIADDAIENEKIQREKEASARAARGEARDIYRFNQEVQRKEKEDTSQSIISRREAGLHKILSRALSGFFKSGKVFTDPASAEAEFAAAAQATELQLESYLGAPVQASDGSVYTIDAAVANQSRERLRATVKNLQDYMFGDKSQTAVRARNLQRLQDTYKEDLFSDPSIGLLLTLPPQAIERTLNELFTVPVDPDAGGPSVAASIKGSAAEGLTRIFSGMTDRQKRGAALSAIASGSPDLVPPGYAPPATAVAMGSLADSELASQQPETYANYLNYAAGQIQYVQQNDRLDYYKKTFTPASAAIIKSLPPELQATAAANMQKIATQFISDYTRTAGAALQQVAYQNGEFRTESTDPYTKNVVTSFNSALSILDTVNSVAPNKMANRDEIAKAYFGVDMPEDNSEVQE